ncbi:TorF family putative porin [Actimicrobium antarcticum]|uniref:TorF family putative porin n=1 Tax=Actimicrobium antarcticum TaxID=1051899 RepID=A0ABP7T5Y1_9BURK
MKRLILATAIAALFVGNFAHAEDAKPDNELSFNAALSSDYRFRGISQSRLKPAVSVGADFVNNPTGFYVGTWASSIKWIKDTGGDGSVELDIYGGKRGEIVPGVSYDVGILTYIYSGNKLSSVPGYANANTTEIYGQVGYGPAYLKYSSAVTDTFGNVDSKNSGYLDLGANIDIAEGTVLNLHVGHQKIKNGSFYSYTDYKVGVTKDFGFASGSIALIGTDANTGAYPTPSGKDNGKTALVVAISKTF